MGKLGENVPLLIDKAVDFMASSQAFREYLKKLPPRNAIPSGIPDESVPLYLQHVSVCPNHSVGRITPFETRGHVALAGTFGYELDITKLPEEERKMIKEQTEMYHKYNDLVREGDYYPLEASTWVTLAPACAAASVAPPV